MWNLNIYRYSFLFVLIIATLQQKCEDPGFTQASSRVTRYLRDQPPHPVEVQYYCYKGYRLIGSSILTCKSNGNWSSHTPICIRGQTYDEPLQYSIEGTHDDYCKDPGVPTASVRIVYYNNTKFERGTQVKFICNEGYTLWGRPFITCEASGNWSAKTPHCETRVKVSQVPKSCPLPETLENGAIVDEEAQPDEYLIGAQISYACYENFRLKGSAAITCTSEEKWDNPVPECIPESLSTAHQSKMCKLPALPQHGTYSVKVKASMLETEKNCCHNETVLQYKCTNNLYTLKANGKNWDTFPRICTATGSWSANEPQCNIVCGRSMEVTPKSPYILFGDISGRRAFPWQAAISWGEQNVVVCGGVLISSQWVLTAAHCVCEENTAVKLPKESILVFLGKFYRDNAKDDSHVQRKEVSDMIVHGEYNHTTFMADIALISLKSKVTYTEWVIPACLPSVSTDWPPTDAEYGIIAGWGLDEDNKTIDELKKGLMIWAKPEECNQYLTGKWRVQPDMYCAVTNETEVKGVHSVWDLLHDGKSLFSVRIYKYDLGRSGVWTCGGDSGGAMVFARVREDGNRRYVAEGLVSWGRKDCLYPMSVLVQIRYYLKWIMSLASIDND